MLVIDQREKNWKVYKTTAMIAEKIEGLKKLKEVLTSTIGNHTYIRSSDVFKMASDSKLMAEEIKVMSEELLSYNTAGSNKICPKCSYLLDANFCRNCDDEIVMMRMRLKMIEDEKKIVVEDKKDEANILEKTETLILKDVYGNKRERILKDLSLEGKYLSRFEDALNSIMSPQNCKIAFKEFCDSIGEQIFVKYTEYGTQQTMLSYVAEVKCWFGDVSGGQKKSKKLADQSAFTTLLRMILNSAEEELPKKLKIGDTTIFTEQIKWLFPARFLMTLKPKAIYDLMKGTNAQAGDALFKSGVLAQLDDAQRRDSRLTGKLFANKSMFQALTGLKSSSKEEMHEIGDLFEGMFFLLNEDEKRRACINWIDHIMKVESIEV